MLLRVLVGLALFTSASIDAHQLNRFGPAGVAAGSSLRQKDAAVRPLVRSATECVARTLSADPRFDQHRHSSELGELIVESMQSCADAMRAMIDGYDRVYGAGVGETFFMGPYLDVLPSAVRKVLGRGLD